LSCQYSTAKAGLIALAKTLAVEGKKYNIIVNTLAPSAGTAMTQTIWYVYQIMGFFLSQIACRPQEMVDTFKPDFVAPVVAFLTSKGKAVLSTSLLVCCLVLVDNDRTTGRLFEVMGGWAAETRWQRSGGHGFPHNRELTPEDVISKWSIITGFCKAHVTRLIQSLTLYPADGRDTHPTSTQEALAQVIAQPVVNNTN
jgi:multifunctional beta-oxidation protein